MALIPPASRLLTNIPYLLNLPLEIRIEIYKQALEPRILTFTFSNWDHIFTENHDDNKDEWNISYKATCSRPLKPQQPIPALLQVCSQIRADLLTLGLYKHFHHGRSGRILPLGYFNPQLDILDFTRPNMPTCSKPMYRRCIFESRPRWNCMGYAGEHQMRYFMKMVSERDRGEVKRIVVPDELFDNMSRADVEKILESFKHLELVIVSAIELGDSRRIRNEIKWVRWLWEGCVKKVAARNPLWVEPRIEIVKVSKEIHEEEIF